MQVMGANLQKILPALVDWIAIVSFAIIGLYFCEFDQESIMNIMLNGTKLCSEIS